MGFLNGASGLVAFALHLTLSYQDTFGCSARPEMPPQVSAETPFYALVGVTILVYQGR